MAQLDPSLFMPDPHAQWIRLRTLVLLRWVAVAGQIFAITIAELYFGLDLNLGLAYLAIGVAIVGNLVAVAIYPENRRLSESEALLFLLFDLVQLAFLLMVTGGLSNPFALLILVPVSIAASVLPARDTVILGAMAIILITGVGFINLPLQTTSGFVLQMPAIFVFGFWCAIVIGVIFLGFYARRVTSEVQAMSQALLATQMALAREQKLTDLSGVVAAAAHELGTPLATIKLAAKEMRHDLLEQPELLEDIDLIGEQADRCRDILRSMGRAGKDDKHLRMAPLQTVIEESAEPHVSRGKAVHFEFAPLRGSESRQPNVLRKPEIVHGLRNVIQNAVDFAKDEVDVDVGWDDNEVYMRIMDDGPGYPPHILGRIGDPFVRRRRRAPEKSRAEYEGMGLGLFIAKTLLERSGAELSFSNRTSNETGLSRGAVVEARWPRATLEASPQDGLGDNPKHVV